MIDYCFKCYKKLEPAFSAEEPQRHEAVTFTASGNYGSTVFDPPTGGAHLIIQICDECLIRHKTHVVRCTSVRQEPEYHYSHWDPEAEYY